MIVGTSLAVWSLGAFVFYLIAGRTLGPEAYGLAAALQGVIVLLATPAGSLQWSIARTIASSDEASRADAMAAYRRAVIMLTAAAAVLAVVASAVTAIIDSAAGPIPLWPLIITYFSVVGFVPLFLGEGALQGEHRYTGFAWSYGATGVLRVPLLLLLFMLPIGLVDATVLAVGLAFALGAVWAVWLTRSSLASRMRPTPTTWRAFSGPLPIVALGLAGIAVLSNIDVVAAKLAIGGGDAGLFGAAAVVAKVLLLVPQALTVVLLPRVAERQASGQRTGSLLAIGVLAIFVSGALAMLLAIPLEEPIMTLAFGPQFAPAASLLVPFFGATTLLGALLILVNHHVARSDHRFIWAVAGLAVLQIGLLVPFSGSSAQIIAVDAVVAALGLIIHEIIYFKTDESMVRGLGAQVTGILRAARRRIGDHA